MVRFALLIVVLLSLSVARADDDDALLDTPPLGEGIPERVEQLEREWADDVGTKEPADEAPDDADADAVEPEDPTKDDAPEPVKARPVDEVPRPAPPSALPKPRRDAGKKPADNAPTGDVPAPSPPSRAERRATDED